MPPSRRGKPELIAVLLQHGRELSTRMILFHQKLAGQFDLNATDHKCLDLARHEPAVTAGRLAELTGLTTGAITAALDRLERAGFIQRERDPADRRRVIVRARPEGLQKLAPHFADFARSMAALHEHYTVAEMELLIDYHLRCIKALKDATAALGSAADQPTPTGPLKR